MDTLCFKSSFAINNINPNSGISKNLVAKKGKKIKTYVLGKYLKIAYLYTNKTLIKTTGVRYRVNETTLTLLPLNKKLPRKTIPIAQIEAIQVLHNKVRRGWLNSTILLFGVCLIGLLPYNTFAIIGAILGIVGLLGLANVAVYFLFSKLFYWLSKKCKSKGWVFSAVYAA